MSQEQLTHISKVQIHKLWGKYDIEWNLNKDVNILSGLNGSGKSTVLRIIADAFKTDRIEKCLSYAMLFNDGTLLGNLDIINIIDNEEELGKIDEVKEFIPLLQQNKERLPDIIKKLKLGRKLGNSSLDLADLIDKCEFIETFDCRASQIKLIERYNLKNDLEASLHSAQIKYRDYQLNLNKKQKKLISSNADNAELNEIYSTWNYFLDVLDRLFAETNKTVDREQNELAFLLENKPISAYDLSAGEKQLILILLTALIQDCKPSILLLDEPEISLHTDWQEELLDIIRTLNPNAQLIVVTHSPSMIINGWLDRITTMEEITIK